MSSSSPAAPTENLGPYAIELYEHLAALADRNGHVVTGLNELARELHRSKSTVSRAARELRKAKLLRVHVGYGHAVRSIYTVR